MATDKKRGKRADSPTRSPIKCEIKKNVTDVTLRAPYKLEILT